MITPQTLPPIGKVHSVPNGPGCMDALFDAVWSAQRNDVIIVPDVTRVRVQAFGQLIALGKLGSVTVVTALPLAVGEGVA